MKIETRKFGQIEVADDKILTMPLGLAGFPGRKCFILLEREETRPFCWLQSVEDPNLALVVINPLLFKEDYSVELKPVIKELAWEEDSLSSLAIYVVLTFHDDGAYRITANLIGPIIINTLRREIAQLVVYDSPYSHQYPVMPHTPPSRQRAVGED